MSKGKQFQDLSTGVFRMTTPTWTINIQSQTASQVMNTSQLHLLIWYVYYYHRAVEWKVPYLINFLCIFWIFGKKTQKFDNTTRTL